MVLDLNAETRLALVDEIKGRIRFGEQKQIAHALTKVFRTEISTEASRLSRFFGGRKDAIEQMLGSDRAEKVLDAICGELKIDRAELVDAARRAARPRPRPAPDRHPAWQELGGAAPWVDHVPGLQEGMDTLRRAVDAHAQSVVWLVGPAGSGKSARLWRAQQDKIGQIVADRVPDGAEPNAVWLVDEPADPQSWIAGAARWQARLVIATRAAKQRSEGQAQLELSPWTRSEVEAFLDQLGDALRSSRDALDAIDLELIADKLAALGAAWTPLDLGNVIRLFVDEPALLGRDANDRELRIRSAMHQMLRRAELSPDQEKLWSSHGRQALALAAATAIRDTGVNHRIAPIGEDALGRALSALAGARVGGPHGEPLRVILERARKENRKRSLKQLETWAQDPTSNDLIELLVETGAWRRTGGAMLIPTDSNFALALAAESLDEDWMWCRLLDTLADPGWSMARMEWAARFRRVQERIDELLATDAAVHVGAIELATALVAFAREAPRPDQVERAVCSAVRLLECHLLTRIELAPRSGLLQEAVREASRRHRCTLPSVTTELTSNDLAEYCTENTRRVVRAVESLDENGPEWLRLRSTSGSSQPAWITYAMLLPWQALPALQDPEGWSHLQFVRVGWEAVVMDHAADGHAWARAVATGDVDEGLELAWRISSRGRLHALEQWSGSTDPQRHERALWLVLQRMTSRSEAPRSQLHSKVVRAVVDFVRRHPEHPLPGLPWLRDHEDVWREALDQAAAVHHLQTWFESERRELTQSIANDSSVRGYLEATPSRLPPTIAETVARLLRLGEVLHRHGIRAPLLGLLEQTKPRPAVDRASVAWELGVGAADALLRLRDAEPLRSTRESPGSAQYDAVESVLSRSHEEETVFWIADRFGNRHDEVLASIVGRPERREAAKRWSLDPKRSSRSHAAARWLIEHPVAGESEHIQWPFTELPVAHSLFYVRAGLAHPDEAVWRAAATLLQRAIETQGTNPDLVSVARCFDVGRKDGDALLTTMGLERYLKEMNASEHRCSASSIRTLIDLTQRHLANESHDNLWVAVHRLCSPLATAACRLQLASLASWVRHPLGEYADSPAAQSHIEQVRSTIANGVFRGGGENAEIDREVLQALADTADTSSAWRACSLLLERESLTDAQLMAEWNAATDAVLVDMEPPTARWSAVQDRLRRRAPRELARMLADRLLALSPELRRLGIPQISLVAMLDARQAARLSALFE